MTSLEDKAQGCLTGLAVGDALGAQVEFKSRDTFEEITGMLGGGPFRLKPGQWTDDTSMALCLAESLIEHRGFDAYDQMQKYLKWYKQGYLSSTGVCFDIGNTTAQALHKFRETDEEFAGRVDESSAGNGSIMRLAPIAIMFHNSNDLVDIAANSSRTTHGAQECIDACKYLALLIAACLRNYSKEQILTSNYTDEIFTENIGLIRSGEYKSKERGDISSSGYVVHTLEAALWCFYKTNSFEEGMILAVNLGNDSDTVGAVYGQLAGAYYGQKSIPDRWLDKLYMKEQIEKYAAQLVTTRDTN